MKRLPLMICCLSLCMTLLTGCDPEGTAARNRLGYLLNDNPDMTAETLLDSLEYFNGVTPQFDVDLPVTDADTRPYTDGRYVNPKTGSSLQFVLSDTVDAPYGIGTVAIHQLADEFFLNKDTMELMVHAWGKGIYTGYNFYYPSDSQDEEQQPERSHAFFLMFVYPGGDSILTTQGFKESENVFRYKK